MSNSLDNLPDKLFECFAEAIVVEEGRALLHIKQGRQICYCGEEICREAGLKVGKKVMINARLIPDGADVDGIPYSCRGAWPSDQTQPPPHLFPRMLEPFNQRELAEYRIFAVSLKAKLPREPADLPTNSDKDDDGSNKGLDSLLASMRGIIEPKPLSKKLQLEMTTAKTAIAAGSSSSESEPEKEKKAKKKKKKEKKEKKEKKGKKEKKSKKEKKRKKEKKKRKYSSSDSSSEDERVSVPPKKTKKVEDDIPHHLVLHKLNDMISELEQVVKPEQLEQADKAGSAEDTITAISYPTPGVAYDPKQVNTWSNMRGFKNPATLQSNWLGLSVAPGAIVSTKPVQDPLENTVLEKVDHGDMPQAANDNDDASNDKVSLFQDIFGERAPSPENREDDDDVPRQAFFKRKEDEINQPVRGPAKSNNLSKALQSRLNRKTSLDERKSEPRTRSQSRESGKRVRDQESRGRSGRSRHESDLKSKSRERSPTRRHHLHRRSSGSRREERSPQSRDRASSRLEDIFEEAEERRGRESRDCSSRSRSRSSKKAKRKKDKKKKRKKSGTEDIEEKVDELLVENEKRSKRKNFKISYSENEEENDEPDTCKSTSPVDKLELESEEDEEKMIEKIRKKRAKLVATMPSLQQGDASEPKANVFEPVSSTDNRVPITCFQQDPGGLNEVKKFQTVILCGSVVKDSQYSQLFELSASVLGHSHKFFQCAFPEILKQSASLSSGSRSELMDTLDLKASKFDVSSKEGLLNVYYKDENLGSVKAVSEKDMLVAFLNFLQNISEPVVLFLHYKDSLLPTLLAKLTRYKLFDHFADMILYCCDLVGLAWSLHMDQLWTGKHYPSLGTIAESVGAGKHTAIKTENAVSLLVSLLTHLMATNQLQIQKVLDMSNKMNLVEYMSVKYAIIQDVRLAETSTQLPDFLELIPSHEAWGVRLRVDLVWSSMEGIAKMLRGGGRCSEKRSSPLPTPPPETPDGEDGVRILGGEADQTLQQHRSALKLRAKQFLSTSSTEASTMTTSEEKRVWSSKSYNAFLAPGRVRLPGRSTTRLELRVPALQPRTCRPDQPALVQAGQDFNLCQVECGLNRIQFGASLFPFVAVNFINSSYHDIELSSDTIGYPVATLRLEQT